MNNRSKLQAVVEAKCPQCRQGDIFVHPITNVAHFTDTNENCPVCGLRYEVEPGFFVGAMYISYAISIAIMVTVFVVVYVLGSDPPLWVYLTAISLVVILSAPFMFRYARVLMLHWFSGISFDHRFTN